MKRKKQHIIQIEKWGRDHWSLLAYIENCVVEYNGKLRLSRMRVNSNKRAFSNGNSFDWQDSWSSILKNGQEKGHDDIDIMNELEYFGFIKNTGTLINPVIKLTKKGLKASQKLREHKGNKGTFSNFEYHG